MKTKTNKKQKLRLILASIIISFSMLVACGFFSSNYDPGDAGGEEPLEPEATSGGVPSPTVSIVPPRTDPTAAPINGTQPALLDARALIIEWPNKIRAGDSDLIRLTLDVDEMGWMTPTAEIEGHVVAGETIYIPDIYDTHNVVASARLDMAGVQISPPDLVSQPLLPGKTITFYWSVHPEAVGLFRGILWFYLQFIALADGALTEYPVSAQMIEIEAVSILGLNVIPARVLGFVGTFVSSILGAPFIEDVLRWIWKKIKR